MALTKWPAGTAFPGVTGQTTDEWTPAWPRPLRAVASAPNDLCVVLDDTGFGQLGCYASPVGTPHFDSLAAAGLRYTNMHTTALCSPSRSCIVTGRNHHANATAVINELAAGAQFEQFYGFLGGDTRALPTTTYPPRLACRGNSSAIGNKATASPRTEQTYQLAALFRTSARLR